jgi:glycosyltransferase involved in cell wall biosynthesis
MRFQKIIKSDIEFTFSFMKKRLLFIERKLSESVSIEKVFRQIAKSLSQEKFEVFFDQLPYYATTISTFKNLLLYRRPKADIYHITGHIHFIALVLPREKTVLTIHDLRILYSRRGLRRFVLKKLFFDLPIKKLKYVTAISEATKNEILLHTKCDAAKIRVIENPLQAHFYNQTQRKFNSQCPTILQIGTSPNKNLSNVIKALRGINCRLRIIGKIDNETLAALTENQIFFDNAVNLNDIEIRNEYEKADIVTFCSTYEGFGLPIIEAQAMQSPVITSNRSPMKEVAGEGAVLIEPEDITSIRNGISNIIDNESLRKDLIKKGIINVKRFESSYIANLYEELYREILDKK